ncbi:saccharopine dehydrogenase C-terminal domain-containing protein [Brevibacillus sp. FSL K6-0770]|jgi:lysine 6-dehydrogenase|uniref:saccharopine dehydrogenase family protein n=1 Tax=Brevibacillus TaxID=55080 RepID=UPI000EC6A22C|nr:MULTISPECIES: saccharopine dehydrogenase C-terminal domain-containing protein [Brevibacillus]MED2253348.1 saccharopine dehydrogenase C-terminal domain-containing protein [Brevibacillus parabrevis]NRQ55860.1 saccharopine dehydrogenase NADP-binding domain-containing protein [Brevibacillus sp. HD1.4A]HBZ81984.1 saccharopine dehydrogenase [Brevibacillus sp.]
MKVLCLGGAGRICRESILDLVQYSSFEKITVADFNETEGRKIVESLQDPRVDFIQINVHDHEDTVNKMRGYDIVMDGTTITLNGLSTACIAEAGCHGVNLNGFGAEEASDHIFKQNGKTCVPGFGMTPGVTQMMAMHAANQLDRVESVRVSHGAFRPIAFSRSITETTTYEYDPLLPGRVVFENGEFIQVPPFARPREIQLPEPYGQTVQYIIPHAETKTLATALADKHVQLIEVRGTWPAKNMQLVRALYDWGFMRNDKINVNGKEIGILDCISEYLFHSTEGQETELYGYSLHVEVIGEKDGQRVQHVLYHTHPASDGSVEGWEKLRAYTRNVGIPMAIATEMIAKGMVKKTGVLIPEDAFDPAEVFAELEKRGIYIHEEITQLDAQTSESVQASR